MKKVDLAYIAGIVDGEGSIGIYRQHCKSGYLSPVLHISVTNTNEWLIRYLYFNFGGSILHSKRKGNCKDMWKWKLQSQKAAELIDLISPYLKLKKGQADIAASFQRNRYKAGHHHKPKSEEKKATEEAQRIVMLKLNQRGREGLLPEREG